MKGVRRIFTLAEELFEENQMAEFPVFEQCYRGQQVCFETRRSEYGFAAYL